MICFTASFLHQVALAGLAGNPRLRWFDKSICHIVFKNGTAVSNIDHGAIDGMTARMCANFINRALELSKGKWQGTRVVRDLAVPRELQFHYDERICASIEDATKMLMKAESNISILQPTFTEYGKEFIREFYLHPDAYLQMTIQLAFYSMYQRPASTHAVATNRMYQNGRIAINRSCTTEAVTWVKAMLDKHEEPSQKLNLLKVAIDKYVEDMDDSSHMRGCSTHLMGLSRIAEEEGLSPSALFTDPSCRISGGEDNFLLSTSFLGYTHFLGVTLPLTSHGYGCYYNILPQKVDFVIVCWEEDRDTNCSEFFNTLSKALQGIRDLLKGESHHLVDPRPSVINQ